MRSHDSKGSAADDACTEHEDALVHRVQPLIVHAQTSKLM